MIFRILSDLFWEQMKIQAATNHDIPVFKAGHDACCGRKFQPES